MLAANLVLTKVPELARENNLKKSIVIDLYDHKIGIIGYLTPETKSIAKPNEVEYNDEIESLKKEVKQLQLKGIDIIIALGHSGIHKDLEIAKEVEGLDVVIGAHTNTFLWNGTSPDFEEPEGPYPTYVTQASGRRVPVVQAFAYTKYLGQLHLLFDSKGELINADGAPLLLDNSIPQDPTVLNIINRYRKTTNDMTEKVIGKTSVLLDASTCSRQECNIGNLITDAMVFTYAVAYDGEHWTDAPIAIVQSGGIRTSLAYTKYPANITHGDLLTVMPFEGPLVVVTMNGSILLNMMEHCVLNYNGVVTPDFGGRFMQYSGIKVVYDLSKPAGHRVAKAEARCWACDIPSYSKVIEKDIYYVIMPGFVANGGDGYSTFKGLPTKILNYSELIATEYYVSHHSRVYSAIEGRITFLNGYDSEKNSSSTINTSLRSMIMLIMALPSIISHLY